MDDDEIKVQEFTPLFGCLPADPERRKLYTTKYPIGRYFEEANVKKNRSNKFRLLRVPPPIREQTMGSCVLETVCTCAAILNTPLNAWRIPTGKRDARDVMYYDSIQAYTRARLIDLDPRTDPPNDIGTSAWAGFEVARSEGLARMVGPGIYEKPDIRDGFSSYYWCTTVQEAIEVFRDAEKPIGFALTWFRGYSTPSFQDGEYVINSSVRKGPIDGGHMITGRGYIDEENRNGFYLRNSWGKFYPFTVRIDFEEMEYQLSTGAEMVVPVDNPWRT